MANLVTTEILADGPKYYIVKVVGVIDTSDIAATGTIGTAGVTTTGSAVVTFTAGALVPTVGQYVTATGGTGTGIPAGAYVLSIQSATQITLNVPVVTGGTGWTITGTAGAIVVVDPSQMQQISAVSVPTKCKINRLVFTVEPLLELRLWWEATAPVYITDLTGAAHQEFESIGGLTNNAGSGITGHITMTSQGWSASAVLSFNVVIECVKQP